MKANLPITTHDGKFMVPARWLVVAVGTCVGCFGGSIYLAFSSGGAYSSVLSKASSTVERVSAVETRMATLETSNGSLSLQTVQRLSTLEAQNKGLDTALNLLIDQQKLILDRLPLKR